jgi:hypothetical protein
MATVVPFGPARHWADILLASRLGPIGLMIDHQINPPGGQMSPDRKTVGKGILVAGRTDSNPYEESFGHGR